MDNFSEVNSKTSIQQKHYRSCDANNDLDDIMTHLSGGLLKTKSLNQHILDLVRKNSHI